MKGQYCHILQEGAIFALFSYSLIPRVKSWDYDVPDTPAEVEILRVEITNGPCTIDITSCVEELCGLDLSEIENQILENYDRE